MNLRNALFVLALLQFALFFLVPSVQAQTEVLLFQVACYVLTVCLTIYFWRPIPTSTSWS